MNSTSFRPEITPEWLNDRGRDYLPGLAGIQILKVAPQGIDSRLELRKALLAPNGFLHAATVIALADTSCGYGTVANLPQGASGFTTIELKTNFLGTLLEGVIFCRAVPLHLGRTTHVWDADVADESNGRKLAVFRCTQMILFPKK